ncbi:glycoside hydrolase family 76 protein [Periconia macrospinosa]|uniref:Glycoside hydrolase family 76 protein n=1 Tax=Periconia macrospinosa TaxID=97972 RepID=A0A2V1EC25_9PLEO|nr:glycoside hydrolase family 76 protein [Periconia macrospinosa]
MKYTSSLLSPLLYFGLAAASVYSDNANTAIRLLQDKYYNSATGLYKGPNGDLWWQSANIITTIARFGQIDYSSIPTALYIISNTYSKAANQLGASNWKNTYYDDEGWWALAWIASYDLTRDPKYLNTAKDIFKDMAGGWTTPCNGGIWWSKDKQNVNAIANELFISVAAHLANRVPSNEKQDYVNWAQKDWEWFAQTGIINQDDLINDGLTLSTCKNDGHNTWTYNQGVILGGLSELTKAKGDGTYVGSANTLASASTTKLAPNGILTEPASGPLNIDSSMFKGAYVRGLATLNKNAPQQQYTDFLKKNADSAWNNARNSDGLFTDYWQGGSFNVLVTTQASGIDVLVAAAAAVGGSNFRGMNRRS